MKTNYRFNLLLPFWFKPTDVWSWKDKLLFVISMWLYKPFLCKLGSHKGSNNEWNYARYSGEINFYCVRCQKLLKTVALDDLDKSFREFILREAGKVFKG